MPETNEKATRDVTIYIPARNTGHLLKRTVEEIPKGTASRIVLVDNLSTDDTVEIARSLAIHVIEHEVNKGYGGSQKSGYRYFLETGGDLVVMLHSDYQYDPKCIPDLIAPIIEEDTDIVLGSRILGGRALKGGMPIWKYFFNRLLTFMRNMAVGANIIEYDTGFRAFSRKLLESVPFEENSDDFLFDTEILFQVHHFGFKLKEVPIPTRYSDDASMMTFGQGVIYGLGVFKAIIVYTLHILKIRRTPQYLRKTSTNHYTL
jgi:glycosyltransferase involved in cell wall biosynthesis